MSSDDRRRYARLWGALKSCLKPGDHVVSVGTGVFGDGIGEMAESFGCIVEKVSLPYDCSIRESDLAAVEEAIRRVKPVMLTPCTARPRPAP